MRGSFTFCFALGPRSGSWWKQSAMPWVIVMNLDGKTKGFREGTGS